MHVGWKRKEWEVGQARWWRCYDKVDCADATHNVKLCQHNVDKEGGMHSKGTSSRGDTQEGASLVMDATINRAWKTIEDLVEARKKAKRK